MPGAEQRNRLVLEKAERMWLPYVSLGEMLDRLIKEVRK